VIILAKHVIRAKQALIYGIGLTLLLVLNLGGVRVFGTEIRGYAGWPIRYQFWADLEAGTFSAHTTSSYAIAINVSTCVLLIFVTSIARHGKPMASLREWLSYITALALVLVFLNTFQVVDLAAVYFAYNYGFLFPIAFTRFIFAHLIAMFVSALASRYFIKLEEKSGQEQFKANEALLSSKVQKYRSQSESTAEDGP